MHGLKSLTKVPVDGSHATAQLLARRAHTRSMRARIAPHAGPPKLKRPDSGFFSEADPSSDVLPVRSSLQNDPTKRGGRWQSDFIWNSNWAEALDYREGVRRQQEQGKEENAGGQAVDGKGVLSLARTKIDLNRMDVDLSAQLKPRRRPRQSPQQQEQQQQRGGPGGANKGYAPVPAFRGETRQWDRSGKFSRKAVASAPTPAQQEAADAQLAAERDRYEQLKAELQLWAVGLTAICFAATFAFYGRDISASYGVGAVGGLLYLRGLHRSVDGFGTGLGGALGGQRLLIPVILALGYNRFNELAAEDIGITLQLLPMLVGFFTYKIALVARQSVELFGELAAPFKEGAGSATIGGEGGSEMGRAGSDPEQGDVSRVDRAFARKTLMQ